MSKKEEESVNDNLAFSDAADESHVDEQTLEPAKIFIEMNKLVTFI